MANGADAVANGADAVANGADAVANGADAVANGADAVANGADAVANGADAVANGADAVANGADAVDNGADANGTCRADGPTATRAESPLQCPFRLGPPTPRPYKRTMPTRAEPRASGSPFAVIPDRSGIPPNPTGRITTLFCKNQKPPLTLWTTASS